MDNITLREIIEWTGGQLLFGGSAGSLPRADISFDGIVSDSRAILPGCLFLALKGENFDGNNFVAAALEAGAKPEQLAPGLVDFKGAGRRFEILGVKNGVTIADDYAHHPAELRATLDVAKTLGYNKVWAVFQPFTYSRTSMLLDDFASALAIADRVVMSEIMGSREENTYNIYTKDLAALIPGSVWFDGFAEIADYVMANAESGDLVITLGCGDVYKCAKLMLG